MTELTVVFIGIALLLYVLLGGADYGAGIIEIFTGSKGINTISRAIAPVWEANHIWIIVVIVILFNAFPEVYSTISLYLHIPIMLVLVGIIFRGTAFTFRYYDPFEDRTHRVYSFVFKLFSLLTPLFLGVTLGAVIQGKLTTDITRSYYERFVAPWLTPFNFSLGIFIVVLFAFLASVYLSGEPGEKEIREKFVRYSKILLLVLVLVGGGVFLVAELSGLRLLSKYFSSPVSIVSIILATVLLPALLISLKKGIWNLTRLVAGAQTAAILIGWFGFQLPELVILDHAESLTLANSIAPPVTIRMLLLALFVGLAFVIPLLLYLFKVFKFSTEKSSSSRRSQAPPDL